MFTLVLKILLYFSLSLADCSQSYAEQKKNDQAVFSDTTNKNSVSDFTIIVSEKFEIEENNFKETNFCYNDRNIFSSNYVLCFFDNLYFSSNIFKLDFFCKSYLYIIFLKIII